MSNETINRESAVALLRKKLLSMGEPDKPMCQTAQKNHILCRGFDRYSNEELRTNFAHAGGTNPSIPRYELERRAAVSQLTRQRESGDALICDTQWKHYETCRGWDDFTNDDLARYCRELLGLEVTVTGSITPPVI